MQSRVGNARPNQAIARDIQRHGIARRQRGGGGDDLAGVLHVVAHQHHATGGRNQALIANDAGVARTAAEAVVASHEVGIADVERGGHEAAHVDLCPARKQHACRVAEEDLPVRVELAVDLADTVAHDAVQGHSAGTGLVKGDAGSGADVKGLPVNGGARTALLHSECIAGLADGGDPSLDLPASGQGILVQRPGHWGEGAAQHGYQRRSSRVPCAAANGD